MKKILFLYPDYSCPESWIASCGMLLPVVALSLSVVLDCGAATFISGARQNIVTTHPENLKFKTGLKGDSVTLSYGQFRDVPISGVYVVKGPFAAGCHSVRAEFGGGIITGNSAGSAQHWFKVSDSLEYTLSNSYYGNAVVDSRLNMSLKLSETYTLCSNGTPSVAGPAYAPFINTTKVTFRLTKDILDTPTYIPSTTLANFHMGYYIGSASIPDFLSFIGSISPQVVFKVDAGYLAMPNPACTMTPSVLNVDFGTQTPSSINGLQKMKNVSVRCSKNTHFSMTLNANKIQDITDGVSIVTSDPSVFAKITSDRVPSALGKFSGYEAQADRPLLIPLNVELLANKPNPGAIEGEAWATFAYD